MAFNYKFDQTSVNGIKTTGVSRHKFGAVANLLNAVQDAKLRIESDTSRTESERKALMRKLLDEASVKVDKALDSYRAEVAVNLAGRTVEARNKAKGYKSLVENLQLFAALKGALPNGTDIKGMIMQSPELSSCIASLPEDVLKANGLSAEFAEVALKTNFPEIAEADNDFDVNNEEMLRLESIARSVIEDVESRSLGKVQAEKRVDEDNLLTAPVEAAPTPEPQDE